MNPTLEMIFAVIIASLGSSGLWSLITSQRDKKDAKTQMLLGLAHDRITYLGLQYIKRKWVTHEEYQNLREFLFEPYTKLGGNGSAKKIMLDVDKLEIRNLAID